MSHTTSYASGIFTTDGPRYPFGSMVRSYGSGALGEVRVMKSPSGMTVSPLPANYAAVPVASPSPSLLTPRNALIAAGVVGLAALGYVVLSKKKGYVSNAHDEREPVLFRKDRDGVVFAILPMIEGSPGMVTVYDLVGEHGSGDLRGMIATSKPATPQEYARIKSVLEAKGYVLKVMKRAPSWAAIRRAQRS